jgi:four helix bundle protein
MSKEYNHRNLIVWQRAQELAHQMIQLTKRLPQSWANAVLARQVISAATSIGANIAEGHGRFTPGAHGNHLSIAKGSAAETDSWLDSLCREGYLTRDEEAPLHRQCMEIMAMLTSKILDLERLEQTNSRGMREEAETYSASEQLGKPPFPFVPEDYE